MGPIEGAAIANVAMGIMGNQGELQDFLKKENTIKEKELKEERALRAQKEREFNQLLVNASTVLAEYKTKEKLKSQYIQGISSYSEMLAACNREIADLKAQINSLEQSLKPKLSKIETIEEDIKKMLYLYEEKNKDFDKNYHIIKAFLIEQETMVKDKIHKVVKRKQIDLIELENELVDIEEKILQQELNRLNIQEDIQPDKDKLDSMRLSLAFLENEKTQKEQAGLFLMLSSFANQDKKEGPQKANDNIIEINASPNVKSDTPSLQNENEL